MFKSSEGRRIVSLTETVYGDYYLEQLRRLREVGPASAMEDTEGQLNSTNLHANVRAGYTYLATAQVLLDEQDLLRASRFYRQAGDLLSGVGHFNEAAAAYEWAGDAAVATGDLEAGIRLFARSKKCFLAAGDSDLAGWLYIKEEDAKCLLARAKGHLTAWIRRKVWRATSGYGERFGLWSQWVAVMLLIFTTAYELLHHYGAIGPPERPWFPVLSALYFTAVTTSTLGYGDYQPMTGAAQAVVILNVTLSYVFLGIGIAVLSRRIMGR